MICNNNALVTVQGLMGTSAVKQLIKNYETDKARLVAISGLGLEDPIVEHFFKGNSVRAFTSNMFRLEPALKSLNSEYWSKAMNLTDILDIMPAKKRSEWHALIHELKCPNFEEKTIVDTLSNLLLNRDAYFADRVDGVFRALSRNHKTNEPSRFSETLIVSWVISGKANFATPNHNTCEHLTDLRSCVGILTGRDHSRFETFHDVWSIIRGSKYGEWMTYDAGALQIKVHKNGTAHIRLHPEIVQKLNRVLAHKYPTAIAGESPKAKAPVRPLSAHGRFISEKVLDCISTLRTGSERFSIPSGEALYLLQGMSQEQQEYNSIMSTLGAEKRGAAYAFLYDPKEVLDFVMRIRTIPDPKGNQFYPTPAKLAEQLVQQAITSSINPVERVLEPSAGNGRLCDAYKKVAGEKASINCIEVDPVLAEVLKSKGYSVEQKDFLECEAKDYDLILMNPPFAEGEAKRHLLHAHSMQPGVIAAILPASLRGFELDGYTSEPSDPITGEFEGTGVSVVLAVYMRT